MVDIILEYLPIVIVAAIIGSFTIAFLIAYAALRKHKGNKPRACAHIEDTTVALDIGPCAKQNAIGANLHGRAFVAHRKMLKTKHRL